MSTDIDTCNAMFAPDQDDELAATFDLVVVDLFKE
jgi:hypothetical protein